eukprot:GFKZ01009685.1.p1 GENE.GFKZ01009685.1~~GFKZ01009685.1.p1  ORF type:complete len:220 (-),score=15.76 GFKZ01009685.1:1378-2037(-)
MSLDSSLLAVFGPTTSTGIEVCTQALQTGFRVRALLHPDASKPPQHLLQHPEFHHELCNITDREAIYRCLDSAAFVICTPGDTELSQRDGLRTLIDSVMTFMPQNGVKRFLYQGTAFCRMPGAKRSLMSRWVRAVHVPLLGLREALEEHDKALVELSQRGEAEWCVVLPGRLIESESLGELRSGGKSGGKVAVKDLAALELRIIQGSDFNGQAILPRYG